MEKTEKQKMLAGELYFAEDPELVAENKRACRLLRMYNATTEEQQEQRQQIIQELFGNVGQKYQLCPHFTVTMAVIFLLLIDCI